MSTKVEGCDCTECRSRNEQGKCDKPGISVGPTHECQNFEYMFAPASSIAVDMMTADGKKIDDLTEEKAIIEAFRAKWGRNPTPKELADVKKSGIF